MEVVEEEIEDEPAIESENGAVAEGGEVAEPVAALASAVAAKATEEAFIEVPVTADAPEKDDEKTEDQMTEIEEDKQNMGAKQASLDDFRDIPIDADETEVVEASVVEDIPPEAEQKESSPPPKESSPTTTTRKKVTIEETPPGSPKREEAGSPIRKEPSW